MPEPLLYMTAMGVAVIASTVFVLVICVLRRSVSATWLNAACVVGIGLGLAIGYALLALNLSWPPTSGLDRLLTIVVPFTLGIELIVGFRRVPRTVAWMLRLVLSVATPRILLHDSVYLSGAGDWTFWQTSLAILYSGVLLALVWSLLAWLSQRSGGISIPLALCLAIQCAGMTVMMAGYIKGGAAAIPLVATLLGASIAVRVFTKYGSVPVNVRLPESSVVPVIVGVGVVGLFGLLFIGRFFGELSTAPALTLLLAPLLCWTSEAPQLRDRKPWFVAVLRLVFVAIPLLVVLVAAKREFDREMSPLLVQKVEQDEKRQAGVHFPRANHFFTLRFSYNPLR